MASHSLRLGLAKVLRPGRNKCTLAIRDRARGPSWLESRMRIEYCCFISYPHGQENVLVPFVNDFVQGLEKEIYATMRRKIWIDFKFLKGGTRLNEEIGPDLCRSACMILLYTPLYFDREHLYCARELKAMRELEAQRLRLLRDRGKGLIIPIILRGEKKFPKALAEERLYYNFTDIEFNNPTESIRTKFSRQIREIAEYIVELNERLEEVVDDLPQECESFSLPTSEDAYEFVESVLGRKITDVAVSFVVRTTDTTQN